MITITRTHSFAAAHRLYDYEGKCEHLHGHNYRVEITLSADALDPLGMVVDFAVVKELLLAELDRRWDHRTLLYDKDPIAASLPGLLCDDSVCALPFNPTAENMARFLGETLFPPLLKEKAPGVRVAAVTVYETAHCSARWQAPL